MNTNTQIELLYGTRKKSMVVAYLLGAFLGAFGANYFYAKRPELACVVIFLFFFPYQVTSPYMIWAYILYIIAILSGVVITYFAVNDANDKILTECKLIVETGISSQSGIPTSPDNPVVTDDKGAIVK